MKQGSTKLLSNKNSFHKSQYGFSVIEILVSAAIGIFVTAGALSIYASNKSTYQLQQAISGTLKNGRYIVNKLEYSIKNAGYSGFYGSFSGGVENVLNSPTNVLWDIETPVFGYDNVSSSSTIAGISGIIDNTDVLILKSMTNESALSSQASGSSLTIATGSGYNVGNIIIVTDMDNASMFQIDSVDDLTVPGETTITLAAGTTPEPGNSVLISNLFENTATAGQLETLIYALKTGANGRTALFEGRLTTSADAAPVTSLTEIIPNAENMQFIYGIDTDLDDSIDKYIDASSVTSTEWGQVHTIGISLLLSNEKDGVALEENSYSFDSNNFTFTRDSTPTGGDNRLRQPFTTYVKLKNL